MLVTVRRGGAQGRGGGLVKHIKESVMLKKNIPQGHDIPVTQSSTTDHPCEQGYLDHNHGKAVLTSKTLSRIIMMIMIIY